MTLLAWSIGLVGLSVLLIALQAIKERRLNARLAPAAPNGAATAPAPYIDPVILPEAPQSARA